LGVTEIILIAIALSMDAFAVSVTLGLRSGSIGALSGKRSSGLRCNSAGLRYHSAVFRCPVAGLRYLMPGIYFGFFQAFMPLVGYFAGMHFADKIQDFDHWVAFVLLSLIGGKMIKESFSRADDRQSGCDETGKTSTGGEGRSTRGEGRPTEGDGHPTGFVEMLMLSIATSIDALAVGVTFAFFDVNIFKAVAVIGLTTLFISIVGVRIGEMCCVKCRSKAEFLGGAVLVMLGVKILMEHI